MKRIATLLLVAVFALGSVGAAKADGIDIKVKGQWDFAFGWAVNNAFTDNVNRLKKRSNDDFIARHRIRTQVNFISSEYLQAVLMFEIGNLDWGRAGGNSGRSSGGALDSDGVNVETKRAYLDWVIPNTEISVRMGIQGLKLPSTPMGSPLFDADVAGVVVSSPILDWWSVTAFWLRPFDAYYNDTDSGWGNRHLDDEVDVFGLIMPFKGDGWQFTPWGIYAFVGANSGIYDYLFTGSRWTNTNDVENEHTKAWWAGGHLKVDLLDPLIFNFEGMYGALNNAEVNYANMKRLPGYNGSYSRWINAGNVKARGYFLAATLDYKLDWGVPGIFGWYASGDGRRAAKDGKIGRMPVLGNDTGSFKPTSFGTSGKWAIDTDTVISGTGTGTWGVGIKLADMSFIEDLSHTIRVAYYRGTNRHEHIENGNNPLKYSVDGVYLTDKDSVWEVNFDHTYKIYENLTAVVELGWLRLDSDKDVWRNVGSGNKDEKSNAWKAQLIFQYKF